MCDRLRDLCVGLAIGGALSLDDLAAEVLGREVGVA